MTDVAEPVALNFDSPSDCVVFCRSFGATYAWVNWNNTCWCNSRMPSNSSHLANLSCSEQCMNKSPEPSIPASLVKVYTTGAHQPLRNRPSRYPYS